MLLEALSQQTRTYLEVVGWIRDGLRDPSVSFVSCRDTVVVRRVGFTRER